MLERKNDQYYLSGPAGSFKIPDEDEITIKLAMSNSLACIVRFFFRRSF